MPLPAGTRLGVYEVLAKLGEGGMGEVYRGRDTRLDRAVAIKVLPTGSSRDAEARARLTREARALSQLTHPNICTLYDVGEHGDTDYVVMELVEGETLAARLLRGPLPLPQALEVGAQIAEALERAHRAGIVHRDLKPGNVMLTAAGAKLLDFGLAKTMTAARAGAPDGTTLVHADVTAVGTVLGTIQYMSPEQIEGRPADHRSDIFALGAVLFEMITGRRAFAGGSTAALAAAILAAESPRLTALQPAAPPPLERIVRGCLEKEPDRRWQSAQDVAMLLRELPLPARADASRPQRGESRALDWLPWGIAAAAAIAAATLWLRPARPAPMTASAIPVSFTVPPPPGAALLNWVESNEVAVSPDGTRLALVTVRDGIWIRPLGSSTASIVPGSEGADGAFWSPDGRSIAFFANGQLKRIDAAGGAAVPLCEVAKGIGHSGTWTSDGIVFTSIGGEALKRVSTAGGTVVELGKPDRARHETRLLWPHVLPDGRRFLYVAWRDDRTARLMLWDPGRPVREIMEVTSNVEYIEPGYLLFAREGALLARRFDASTATLDGDPIAVAQPVDFALIPGLAHFSASRNGVLSYQSHSDLSHVSWFDQRGNETRRVLPSGKYQNVRLSVDGRQLVVDRVSAGTGTYDLWSLDVARGVETRLTSDAGNEIAGAWTRDGAALVYSAGPFGPPELAIRDVVTGKERPLRPGRGLQIFEDFTPEGAILMRERPPSAGAFRFVVVPANGGDAAPLFDDHFTYAQARFSPDGRWLAYTSNESGALEVSVSRWPASHARLRVSTGGGYHPRWSHDGRDLFYLSPAGLMRMPMSSAGPGAPVVLIDHSRADTWQDFDVAPDGRLVALVSESIAAQQPLTVIVNWTASLR